MKTKLAVVLLMACLFVGVAEAEFYYYEEPPYLNGGDPIYHWDDTLNEEDVMMGTMFLIGTRIVSVKAC